MILYKIFLKSWFQNLIGSIIVFILLLTTTDFINGFLQGKNINRIVLEYLLKMPDLVSKILPLSCLIASLFSLNKLKSHAELIAMMAAGFSYLRFYLIVIISSAIIMVLQFINLGYLEPYANKIKRTEIQKSQSTEGKYLTRSSIENGRFWFKTNNYFANFAYYDSQNKSLHDLEIYYFNEKHHLFRALYGKKAIHQSKDQWIFTDAKEIIHLHNSLFPIEVKKDQLQISIGEGPEGFSDFESDLTTLNFQKLFYFLQTLKKSGINLQEYEVLLWNKIALAWTCILFALIPLSTLYTPNRRSSSFGKDLFYTISILVSFWVIHSLVLATGVSGKLPHLISVFLTPSIIAFFIVYSFIRHRRLSI